MKNDDWFVEFGFGFTSEDFIFQLSTMSKEAPIGKSDSWLDLKADVIISASAVP